MMVRARHGKKIHFLFGNAESLPFESSFFDVVFSINAIHHFEGTSDYFREAFRVLKPGGTICTATDSEKKIRNRKPLAEYWPRTVEIDLIRYPSIVRLRKEMAQAGFENISEYDVQDRFEVTDIGPYRDKAFSCLHFISEDEFSKGLQRLEADLKQGHVQGITEFTLIWGKRL
jgi:ubiquinone/menaquinone biosynthesis C-methylase UbiE